MALDSLAASPPPPPFKICPRTPLFLLLRLLTGPPSPKPSWSPFDGTAPWLPSPVLALAPQSRRAQHPHQTMWQLRALSTASRLWLASCSSKRGSIRWAHIPPPPQILPHFLRISRFFKPLTGKHGNVFLSWFPIVTIPAVWDSLLIKCLNRGSHQLEGYTKVWQLSSQTCCHDVVNLFW